MKPWGTGEHLEKKCLGSIGIFVEYVNLGIKKASISYNVNMLTMGNFWNASCMLFFFVFLDHFQFNASTNRLDFGLGRLRFTWLFFENNRETSGKNYGREVIHRTHTWTIISNHVTKIAFVSSDVTWVNKISKNNDRFTIYSLSKNREKIMDHTCDVMRRE